MDPTRRAFGAGLVGLPLAYCARPEVDPNKGEAWEPAYLKLEREGELARRVEALKEIYSACRLCPRQCGVNRNRGEKGMCGGTARAKVYSSHPHFGEEPPLVGRGGSGTIFFSNCNLLCCFCQNWEINHRGDGSFLSDESLGRMMMSMQNQGCHNVNVVTPTHLLPNIVSALRTAIRLGLRVPIVYNCGGYESLEAVKLLDGIVDIYLPDFKYTDGAMAEKYSHSAVGYPEAAEAVHIEMKRQVGDLKGEDRYVAQRGLIIRHLVLPHNISGTDRFVKFVAEKLGKPTWVNIMAQYRPAYRAGKYKELSRRLTSEEYRQAVTWAKEAGLTHVLTG
jgi:putative pyruvate formate lyase activating enzyme